MTKTILLTFTLLSCTAWMAAQSTTPSTSTPDTSSAPSSQTGAGQSGADSAGMNGSQTTITGCLNSAGSGYTLTDASGTTYQLSGDTSKLSSHVNNQVELKGTASSSDSASSASASSGAASGGQMFNVTKVKKIASTCSNTK